MVEIVDISGILSGFSNQGWQFTMVCHSNLGSMIKRGETWRNQTAEVYFHSSFRHGFCNELGWSQSNEVCVQNWP